MVKRIVILNLLLSCCLNCAAFATEPNDYLIPGKSYMCEGSLSGLRLAYQTLDAGLNDAGCPQCSTNRELKFLHAVTRTAMLFIDNNDLAVEDSFFELADAFGVNITGDYLDFFDANEVIDPNYIVDVNVPLDPNGRYKVPPDAPDVNGISNIVQDWISDINNIVAELNSISDSPSDRFRFFFEPNDTGLETNLEVDYGDLLVFKGLLLAFKSVLESKLAYDVFLDVNETLLHNFLYVNGIDVNDFNDSDCLELLHIINIDVNDPNQLRINDHFLTPYPDLLKVLPTANFPDVNGAAILAKAKADLIAAIDYYFDALNYIRSENDDGNDPQEDELLYIDPNVSCHLNVVEDRLTLLRDSLVNDSNMLYPWKITRTYNVYDSNQALIGQLILEYDILGIGGGPGGESAFNPTIGIPSPWYVSEDFGLISGCEIGIEFECDTGGWYQGHFDATFTKDGSTFSDGYFEWWGWSEGSIHGLSGQLVNTTVQNLNIYLNPILGGTVTYPNPVNPRDLLPLFDKENIPIAGTFGHGLGNDPTLGGILPDMTQEDWAIPLPSDDFNDNSMDTSMWSLYQESPNVWLDETNERLEIRSTADANGEVAGYYANGWGFSTADNFSFRAYFHCNWPLAPEYSEFINILLGLVKGGVDPVMVRNNSIAIVAGYYIDEYEIEAYFHCGKFKNDGTYVVEGQKTRSQDNGILYISYDASKDELYLSDTGYWAANAWVTIPGLLKGEWSSAVVIPGLGSGYVYNAALDSGVAYLDNFVVDSGTVVPNPANVLLSDDFNDNSMNTSLWSLYQESPDVWLDETNERLEVRSTADMNGAGVVYFANGWGLLTADNFSFKADFHCISASGYYEFGTMLGVGKCEGDPITLRNNNATIVASSAGGEYVNHMKFSGNKTTDGNHVEVAQKERSQYNGILYISYDANKDELYLSDTGYWAANAWVTIPGLLKGEWGSSVVIPFLGGSYVLNIALNSGDVYLDNFVVDSGTVGTVFTGKIIYVDADAPGLNNGSSWTDAYKYLQDGLTDARSSPKPIEIWVAQGTYRPDEDILHPAGTGDRMAAFQLINGVAVYGGFPAGGGNWNQRNPNDPNNETILSADIGTPLDKSDNSYHIFYHPDGLNLDDTAILDGFTITAGNANGSLPHVFGGGMCNYTNSSPTVKSCTFSGNSAGLGGGMFNYTNSSPTLTGCTFSGNSASSGGGMANFGKRNNSPTLTNCTFSANSASDGNGGGMDNHQSSPTLTNCTFSGNSATQWGGGIFNSEDISTTVKSCTFSGNSAEWHGGGMGNMNSNPVIEDCTFSGNSARLGGGMCNRYSSPTLTNCAFSENAANIYGGAIYCDNGSPFISNCIITRNTSLGEAGGLILYNCSLPVIDNCTISHNSPNVIWIYQTTADISGTVKVDSENIIGDGGSLWIEPGSTLETSDCNLSCYIVGTGTILVPAGREFVIENEAVVDLSGDGTLQCDGLLRVKDYGNLLYTNLNVARASFENNAVIAYNTITTSVLAPYGQLLAKDTASIIGNDIRAAGDRYIDIDPSTFGGMIQGNSISVTVTEGTGNISAGLFELRGYDINCPSPPCPPGLFQLLEVPEFGLSTWTIDRMELVEGAKVTLTNRVDFQYPYDEGSEYEVLYVKQLILGPNSVLDTVFNRLYYGTLEKHPTAKIKNKALLGFSLGKIEFGDEEEFATRIIHNNFIDLDPAPPDTTRIHIERVIGLPPDPTGMMWLRNLTDLNPESPTYGKMISTRVKVLFAKSTEKNITIRFKYLFENAPPGTELVVYLTDVPDLLAANDPQRDIHYIEVARIPAPPPGWPGAQGSGRFAIFQKTVSTEDLYFTEGIRIEIELLEPQVQRLPFSLLSDTGLEASPPPGASAFLDTWSAEIHCEGICLDLTWDNFVNEVDFVTVICASGCSSELLTDGTGDYVCFEGPFGTDGYIDPHDVSGWEWTLNSDGRKNLCDGIPLSEGTEAASMEADGLTGSGGVTILSNPPGDFNDLLILGKRGTNDANAATKLKDRLYVFNSNRQYNRYLSAASDRCNIKIVQDPNGQIYQINYEAGVRMLDASHTTIIPRGQVTYAGEPRYNKTSTVYVGIKGEGEDAVGRPILDAAFDTAGYIYVAPVVVNPDGNDSYAAAAKLQRKPSDTPPYKVVKIYDDPPPPGDNKYRNYIREIEIDSAGSVYVLNSHALNESDTLWRYYTNGTKERIDLADPDINLPDPVAMYMSNATNMLYLASAQYNADDCNDSVIYGFSTTSALTLSRSITIYYMHQVTGITEDPDSGTLWVVGFYIDEIPEYPDPYQPPFYIPCIAQVSLGSNSAQAQSLLGAHDLAMPFAILWTKTTNCGGADLDGSNRVNFDDFALFRRRWRNSNCAPSSWCYGADLNNNKTVEITDLAIFAQNWLQTDCTGN